MNMHLYVMSSSSNIIFIIDYNLGQMSSVSDAVVRLDVS